VTSENGDLHFDSNELAIKSMGQETIDRAPLQMSKDSFDVALLPGAREQMVEAYRLLRRGESNVLQSVLDSDGAFREGIAHARDCPLCGAASNGASLLYYTHGMHIVQCMKCDLVYSREVINPDADSARYRYSSVMNAHLALHSNSTHETLCKVASRAGLEMLMIETFISEVDRIRAHPETQIVEVARALSGVEVNLGEVDHRWIHKHLLGYKLFGIFRRACVR